LFQATGKAPRRPQAYVTYPHISVTLRMALRPDAARIPRKRMIKFLTPSGRGPGPGLRGMDIPRILHKPAPWDSAWDCVTSTTI